MLKWVQENEPFNACFLYYVPHAQSRQTLRAWGFFIQKYIIVHLFLGL